ncbi:hypothetical protein [Sphingobacterium paucimobilis]|uniref:Uncharacterized protein n=1 Tax=Sphingobacterium paucimobilis HER1398 TaxID=1346330 RepID=U2J5J0_9SPHI|nr:hypothetical protein [Sphingobacterium paucimobilis]ERJ60199.1 hypothetical protein M472_15680 [Sphingobacterium paucimobilis HER1398]
MGIRYEKDTILNWINEMGKFLRLLVEKWEGLEEVSAPVDIAAGYEDFFNEKRDYFVRISDAELITYSKSLEQEQIRPLAQLLMYDGLMNKDNGLLRKAKALFECHMQQTGSFSFEDYGFLHQIEKNIR